MGNLVNNGLVFVIIDFVNCGIIEIDGFDVNLCFGCDFNVFDCDFYVQLVFNNFYVFFYKEQVQVGDLFDQDVGEDFCLCWIFDYNISVLMGDWVFNWQMCYIFGVGMCDCNYVNFLNGFMGGFVWCEWINLNDCVNLLDGCMVWVFEYIDEYWQYNMFVMYECDIWCMIVGVFNVFDECVCIDSFFGICNWNGYVVGGCYDIVGCCVFISLNKCF